MIFFTSFGGGFTGENLKIARTLALTVSVIFELFQVFVSKAPDDKSVWVSNPFNNIYLIGAVLMAFILHLFIVYVKPLANIFELTPITFDQWVLIFTVVIVGIIILDGVKLLQSKIINRGN